MSKRLEQILQRYKVEKRAENQKVTHLTYRFTTILTPDQFAIFEAALKAVYISTQVYHMNHDERQFLGCLTHHENNLFAPNGIDVPYIEDHWTDEKGKEAADDYRYCASLLTKMSGPDAVTGKDRNLYAAVLD